MVLASATLRLLFPDSVTLGATVPAGGDLQSFVLEFILTFVLMFVVLTISAGDRDERRLGGIVIGSVIALEALFAGTGQRGVDEPRALPRAGPRLDAPRFAVGLPRGADRRRPGERAGPAWMHGSADGPGA